MPILPQPPRPRALTRLLLLGVCALAVSACQLRLAADVRIDTDGAGTLELAIGLDEELATELVDAGMDLGADLQETLAIADGWEIAEQDLDPAGGAMVRLRTAFADPAQLTLVVEELGAALDPVDGTWLERLDLQVAEDGTMQLSGRAGAVPPATPGASGTGIQLDADDLGRLLEERGDELVRADLRVTFPAQITSSDADQVDGRTATWRLPVGDVRQISARSAPPVDRTWAIAAAVAAVAAVVAALTVLLLRRRGSRRARRRAERTR